MQRVNKRHEPNGPHETHKEEPKSNSDPSTKDSRGLSGEYPQHSKQGNSLVYNQYSNNNLSTPIDQIPSGSNAAIDRQIHRRIVLESLNFSQIYPSQMNIQEPHAGTCRWILETPEYLDWLDTNKRGNHNGILWIKGIASAGKSTLIKFMLLHARQTMKGKTIISFFFNRRGYELQKSAAGLYRSLLLQLLEARQDLQSILDTIRVEQPLRVGSLQFLFSDAIQRFGEESLICFIDGLDECEESQILGTLRFLASTCEQAASSGIKLRICLASRPFPHRTIQQSLELRLETKKDAMAKAIATYIEGALNIGHSDIAEYIRSEVQERASEANRPQLPNRVRTSKPKVRTGCNNCKQRRIRCDEQRPECTQCIRSSKQCNGYPPPPRTKMYEEMQKPHGYFKGPKITHQDTSHRVDFDPSPSDSGYGTVSYGSRVQVDKSVVDDDNDDEDIQTVYTEFAGPSDIRTESYIDTFANDLFTKIGGKQLSAQMVEKLSHSLPTLLKALALKIGYQNHTQIQRDMMVFIHKQREAITASFKDHYDHSKDLDSETTTTREPKPTEIMDRWVASTDESEFEEFHTEPPEDNPRSAAQGEYAEEAELMIPELEEYRKLIFEDPGYMWMLARLRREIILSTFEHEILHHIRETILWAIPQTNHVSRKKAPEEAQVTFTVDWDIIGFLCQQGYDMPHSEAVANSITLTGTRTHAQALTCRQYMAQMWPLTGSQTLKLIQETLKTTEHKRTVFFNSPCRLTLEAIIVDGSSVIVTASGLPDFIVEIGEQLAWLGSALRLSILNTGICICTPYMDETISSEDGTSRMGCSIKYNIEPCPPSAQSPNGQCWSYLFSNPVIARGFPILHREEPDTGLEMPLELMVSLTGTRYLNTFNSNVFIKGFNTMLVPAKQSEDLLVWHLLYSHDPSERISYLSSDLEHANIAKAGLEQSRHVLGWCADATSIVGTTHATYDIGRSHLPKAHSHHMLEKVEISAGQFVTGTAAFTLGNREKPVHISRFGFLTKLQWISSKHMVLWDERDKRGWLVDGASALLHILRASLAHSKRKFQSAWLLDPGALRDAEDLSRPDASLQVLINEKNRNLTLYMDKTEVYEENIREGTTTNNSSRRQTRHYRLEDKIEHIYNILEKLIDHQTDAERRTGLQIKVRPRQQLEGWDFKDLVKDGDPIFPRVTTLPTIGKGWVDFTRAIHAITLFGSGFGELIQPRQTNTGSCNRWSLLPKESYYLAACVSNLLEIMEEYGDPASNPRRLCDNIIWHMKQATFDPCPCTKNGENSHHDPVQALFPLKFTNSLKKKPQINLNDRGAVIFGHNMSLH
ncbi:hypothetical protein HD806DRAFT_538810 [Xylariaceae sp. AK1471]|nr:hypothetical protein HD806DRAFT_538810 [Xylariaceae sp. AK1471]